MVLSLKRILSIDSCAAHFVGGNPIICDGRVESLKLVGTQHDRLTNVCTLLVERSASFVKYNMAATRLEKN